MYTKHELGSAQPQLVSHIGTSGRRCSRSPLGGRLATTLVATISAVIFFFSFFLFFSFPVVNFSHRRSARIKKTYLAKVA